MDPKKSSNKITEIVRLQQILKKWKKVANASKNSSHDHSSSSATTISSSSSNGGTSSGSKGIKFLKRTLSFTDIVVSSSNDHNNSNAVVPKGFLAVCVGQELKRFIIPTEYLSHQAFVMLLREAEDEFGFQQEGVLKIPCPVSVFEKIIKLVEEKRSDQVLLSSHADKDSNIEVTVTTTSHHPQMCR